jgi:hypothetical protein
VLYAYLRMMGMTQIDAGHAIGRSERIVQSWEYHTTWPLAREEARKRWLVDLTDAARKTLLETVKAGAGELSLKVLERLDADLAPPTQRLQHQHEVGPGLSSLLQAFEGQHGDAG